MLGQGPHRTRQVWSAGTCQEPPHRCISTSSANNPGVLPECSISQSAGRPDRAACKQATVHQCLGTHAAKLTSLALEVSHGLSATREHRRSRSGTLKFGHHSWRHDRTRSASRPVSKSLKDPKPLNACSASKEASRPADQGGRQPGVGSAGSQSHLVTAQGTTPWRGMAPRQRLMWKGRILNMKTPENYFISLTFSFFMKTPGWSDFIVCAFSEHR